MTRDVQERPAGGPAGAAGRRFSARALAELLHTDPASPVQYPTADQARVIEAPLEPLLVVAGAGSGKTKTMADRVVWLVANELVRPEQILGVTFTRKAAGELGTRIRQRLAALYRALDGEEAPGQDRLDPTVSTYHSFANGIVQDYGLRIGVERDSVMLGTAQAWQLAVSVVEAYSGEWSHFTAAKSTLVNAVLGMAGECAEHLTPPSVVRAVLREHIEAVEGLQYSLTSARKPTQAVANLLDKLRTRVSVTELVDQYAAAKLARRQLDFGDLVALAARIAQEIPEATAMERQKYEVVLLDEFQDTSHAQMVLFSRLFADGRAVTAVGDPHQSIYGFRGASAGQLGTFRTAFPVGAPGGALAPSPVSNLSVAWRNSTAILAAANTVSAALNMPAPWLRSAPSLTVPGLSPRPGAPLGEVRIGRFLADAPAGDRAAEASGSAGPGARRTVTEAEAVAAEVMFHSRRTFERDDSGDRLRPTIAVLCRGRKQFEPIRRELERNGIPVQIVGLGGLLRTPEIVEMLAVLRVLGDPDRSDSMLRLLAGARWRIGPADLMALGDWSRQLARAREAAAGRSARAGEVQGDDDDAVIAPDAAESGSLVEAVDHLPPEGWESGAGRSLTSEGRDRLGRLRDELRRLRDYVGDDLGTIIGEVERSILLDIEVAAKPGVGIHDARRNLDAFSEAVAGFTSTAERVDLPAFLAWLEAADAEEDGLPVTQLEASREAVQLLTVHASKGLEWDVVLVPGLNEGSFPSGTASRWSSGDSAIPWTLRGDAPELPQWDWEQPDSKEWLESEKRYADEARAHAEREERRLAYVAFTRAKHVLVCTSSAWGGGRTRPTPASGYLLDLLTLAEQGEDGFAVLHWLAAKDEGDENPAAAVPQRATWPIDPLGPRRPALSEAAGAVAGAAQAFAAAGPAARDAWAPPAGRWSREVELALARRAQDEEKLPVTLPAHISASTLVELGEDPAAVLAQLRRPVPRQPGSAARKGTAFHAWIEEFYGTSGMLDLGEYPGAADAHVDEALGLDEMAETFRNSSWAARTPAGIEVPIETKVGGVIVRGRIDAVFQDADGGWDLIDWKTGRPPSEAKRAAKSVQLALYRLAWARLKEVPLESVRAAFFYVADKALIRPHDLAGEAELEGIIAAAVELGG
ncbi:ATP-dependent helicase [Arthrobacter zhaoguopingii]|uniref:ATP-dependent helicase n=1 Tax=Arthrobacter zhaoguopingii TaxID=2681491 RepID=UPI001358961F|nr:ATP-dependent DNA helicase [Arthrobacter zhaoguopingii]